MGGFCHYDRINEGYGGENSQARRFVPSNVPSARCRYLRAYFSGAEELGAAVAAVEVVSFGGAAGAEAVAVDTVVEVDVFEDSDFSFPPDEVLE